MADQRLIDDLKAKYQQEHEGDAYELTEEKLPKDYLDQYGNPDTFNQEYHKYVSHIKAEIDENGEVRDDYMDNEQKLDFYREEMNDREDEDDEFDGIQTRDVD